MCGNSTVSQKSRTQLLVRIPCLSGHADTTVGEKLKREGQQELAALDKAEEVEDSAGNV